MTPDEHWRKFRTTGDPAALGALFDAVSPELFRVALSLAKDAASAEDALQETWLVALRSADRHDAARPVVAWLVGILRRKVHEGRREARRPDETRVRRPTARPDPSLVAESAEEAAHLRAAIDALPASYREVAVLRWRYGLEPGEIADARGMPPGTVRSLLHRALGRLRKSFRVVPALFLGARWPRGLDEVRANVLRAAAGKSVGGTAALVAGGVLVAKTTKTAVLVAVACLLLGAGAVVELSGRTSAPDTRSRETAVAVPRSGGTNVQQRPTRSENAATERVPAATEKPFARGIVVDEAGSPIAGCRVLVRGHEDQGGIQDAPVRLDATAAAVTGTDGRFVVPKRPDDLASLTFVADGYEAVEERSFDADLRVVLQTCGSFAARVVDTSGAPMAGADVRVIGAWVPSEPRMTCVWLRSTTDDEGRFEFRSLPGEARLSSILAWGYQLQGPPMNFLPEQEVYVLERTCLIVDVTDAATRAPVPDALGLLVAADGTLIGALEPQPAIASTPPRAGRLFWSRSRRTGDLAAELRVFASGHVTRSRSLAMAADSEPPLLAVTLEPGAEDPSLAGRVIDGAGAVVSARFAPLHDGRRMIYGSDLHLPIAATTTVAADGAFAITGVPPGRYRLTVTRADEPSFSLDADAPATSLELRFPAKAALEVRYVDTAGRPVADAWMHVQTRDERFGWDAQTDSGGVARFDALPAGELDVLAVVRGVVHYGTLGGMEALKPHPCERRTLAANETAHIELVQPDRCRVTVLVRDDTGSPLANVEIHAVPHGGLSAYDQVERERVNALAPTTDAMGRVTFDVFPCRGEVKALRQGHVHRSEFAADVGSAPTVEIVIPSITGIVRGRVLERGSGAPVAGRPVKVWWDHKLVAESATDDEGRFTATGVPAGRVRVGVEGYSNANDPMGRRVDPKSPYGHAETEFDMAAGEDRTVAFTMARIKGRDAERPATSIDVTVVDAAGTAVAEGWLDVKGRIDGAWCSLGDVRTDAAGRAHLDVVAAERYVIRARAAGSSYPVGEKIVSPPQLSVERDPAAAIVERMVLAGK